MPIRIIPHPVFRAAIPFTVAGQESPAVVTFDLRHKSPQELRRWAASFAGRETAEIVSDVVVAWVSGVVDDDGAEVPYSKDNLELFLASHGSRATDLLHAYQRELLESRQKN